MTYALIANPSRDLIQKWGPLAYVDDKTRKAILDLPSGQFKPAIKALEKQVSEMKKKQKAAMKGGFKTMGWRAEMGTKSESSQ